MDGEGNEIFCSPMLSCASRYECVKKQNPNYGMSSFDNILKSVLNIFVIITLEGWTDLMYMVRRATGTVAYDCFFLLVVIIGAFFILNLMIAVQFSYISQSFKDKSN